jgi:hypothetical protein
MSESNPATLVYGMRSKAFDPEEFDSIAEAFETFADEFGAERGRAILVSTAGEPVDANNPPIGGKQYKVSIKLGDKGTD